MKYLFLSLLLLNILYALWQFQVRAPVPSDGVGTPLLESQLSSVPSASGHAPGMPDEPLASLCVTLGRFSSAGEAEQLRQRLLVLDIAAEVRAREAVVGTDYWLAMPVTGGEQQAVMQLSALQERGLDSFLITRGEMAGQISLGVFSREDNAQLRREQLQEQGLEVHVHALSKTEQQFVVEVGGQARRLVDQAMLSRLRSDFPSLQHQYQPCTGVANGSRIP